MMVRGLEKSKIIVRVLGKNPRGNKIIAEVSGTEVKIVVVLGTSHILFRLSWTRVSRFKLESNREYVPFGH